MKYIPNGPRKSGQLIRLYDQFGQFFQVTCTQTAIGMHSSSITKEFYKFTSKHDALRTSHVLIILIPISGGRASSLFSSRSMTRNLRSSPMVGGSLYMTHTNTFRLLHSLQHVKTTTVQPLSYTKRLMKRDLKQTCDIVP